MSSTAEFPAPSIGTAPDFERSPFIAFWETTRSCDLACRHCRADACTDRDPGELTLREAETLFRDLRDAGTRLLVLTGGDPFKRSDIFDLIGAANDAGLMPALSPSVTPLLTRGQLATAAEAGVSAVSLSLDAASADTHDNFRGVPGAYDRTLLAARWVRDAGIELRINTTVTRPILDQMPELSRMVRDMDARSWVVFFLVPVGRAATEELQITPHESEVMMRWLYGVSKRMPYRIKTTEGQHYRRVVLQQMAAEQGLSEEAVAKAAVSGKGRYLPGINAGRGVLFVSHRGDVHPSGFLPQTAGNVRDTPASVLYRTHPTFTSLRDPDQLAGKCGRCPFRVVCGGSRARAWAVTGELLASDDLCDYEV